MTTPPTKKKKNGGGGGGGEKKGSPAAAAAGTEDADPNKGNNDDDESSAAAVAALFRDHQATSPSEIRAAAERRKRTLQDMVTYAKRIFRFSSYDTDDTNEEELTRRQHEPHPPHPPSVVVHVAGTKGKGSTSCMCEVVLRNHGYKTGLFTSPHLVNVRERIRIDGRPVSKRDFAASYWKLRRKLEEYGDNDDIDDDDDLLPPLPGYFRMLVLVAFDIFASHGVDAAVFEVGMGGRYDATNVVDDLYRSCGGGSSSSTFYSSWCAAAEHDNDDNGSCRCREKICGVTLLDYDHVRVLGDTLEQIAYEKAGIFRRCDECCRRLRDDDKDDDDDERVLFALDSPTYSESVRQVLRDCARDEGDGTVRWICCDDLSGDQDREEAHFYPLLPENWPLGLSGQHQRQNAELALQLCRAAILQHQKRCEESRDSDGGNEADGAGSGTVGWRRDLALEALRTATWPGRCHRVDYNKNNITMRFWLDGAHTVQSVRAGLDWFLRGTRQQQQHHQQHEPQQPILLFTCSHERNPVELLQLLLPGNFGQVFFVETDSSKPSSVRPPLAARLLGDDSAQLDPGDDAVDGECTWQDTLQALWKHLETKRHRESSALGDLATTSANVTVSDALDCIERNCSGVNDNDLLGGLDIFVTGSLYLVGSVLNAIDWTEEEYDGP